MYTCPDIKKAYFHPEEFQLLTMEAYEDENKDGCFERNSYTLKMKPKGIYKHIPIANGFKLSYSDILINEEIKNSDNIYMYSSTEHSSRYLIFSLFDEINDTALKYPEDFTFESEHYIIQQLDHRFIIRFKNYSDRHAETVTFTNKKDTNKKITVNILNANYPNP
jgi:hypothetical protein